MRSVKAKLFSSVASVVTTGAPRKTERGEFPKVYGAGFTKAQVLNHSPTARSLDGSDGSPTRFGRNDPAGKALVVFAAVITVNAGPDSAVSSTPIFQPPRSAFTARLPLNFRTSYNASTTNRCGTSLPLGPLSRRRLYASM